jgi:hypothetical protein
MELERLLAELERAAERLGVPVRTEPFDPGLAEGRRPRTGLCTVKGARLILVDARAPLPDRVAILAASLAALDHEALFLAPVVRATIAAYRPTTVSPEPASALPLKRTKPWVPR